MVKKLIKYDFQSYFRLLLPVQLALIGIAAVNRVIQLFETSDSVSYDISFGSSIALYIISIIGVLLMTLIVAIVRFYQGMYTHEGYLNHTLPVTPAQHIIAKLLTSVLFLFGSLLAIFLSFMIITMGDVNIEIFKAFGFLVKKYFGSLRFEGAVYILEAILVLIVASCKTVLKLYFCISIGQLVSRKKILLAFGVYFGLYTLQQIIGTVFIIIVALNPIRIEQLMQWLMTHPHAAVHIYLCGALVMEAIFGTVYFLISKHIMSKKLNLA